MSRNFEPRIKRFSIANILSFLEDRRYPSIGPHLWLLELSGLWHPNLDSSRISRFKQYIFYVTVVFFLSQYVKCLIRYDDNSLRLILHYAPFHVGIVKACFFHKDYLKWERVIEYISSTERDQLDKNGTEHKAIINDYIKWNRRVTYFFWTMVFFANFIIFTEPYQKNQVNENGTSIYVKMFDGYTPFSNEPPGYYMSMAIQTVLGYFVSTCITGWDTFVVSIMTFFAGQLKIARVNSTQIIIAGNDRESHINIVRCHQHFSTLVKYQEIFKSLISPTMFVYLVVCSINLGVCIIQISQTEDDLPTLISGLVFLEACLIQLLLFYWHANEVTEQSALVSYGTFESDWFMSDRKVQKEVLFLGLRMKKKVVFNAGPFTEMSLSTFIGVLRLSYSFFTLLSETN